MCVVVVPGVVIVVIVMVDSGQTAGLGRESGFCVPQMSAR